MSSVVDIVREFPDTEYRAAGPTHHVENVLEGGMVLSFPHMPFMMTEAERRFLDPRYLDGRAKNISVRWPSGTLRGAAGSADELTALRAMLVRFAEDAHALANRLFPHYAANLVRGNTSFRPVRVEGRAASWRKDDSRLHVDAFPSNPTRGVRLLRVFANVNPSGEPRRWRVGESFEDLAKRHVAQIGKPLPGSAKLLRALRVTKAERTEYDHVMLQLHDRGKADLDYQREAPQKSVDFMPGTTWVVFSDQVQHAAMGGQHMMEQTFMLNVEQQLDPETSPLRTLERLRGRPLR
jgi:3-deoxy-D-manno-oct-2-ulosonic acid (Kdo) hydroxylase